MNGQSSIGLNPPILNGVGMDVRDVVSILDNLTEENNSLPGPNGLFRLEHNNRTQFKLEPPDIFQSQSEGYQSGTGSLCGSGSSGMFTPDLSPSNETVPVNLIPSDIFPNLAKPQTNHFDPNPNQNGVGAISFRVTSSTIPQLPTTLPKLEAKPIDQTNQNPYPEMPKRKSKKGPAPKLFGNEKCKICESRATGFHYNVLSCEACKNFFRRAVVHKLKYECKNGQGICSVQSGHRPRCQYCRMSKCREMGMKDEYINRMGRNRKSSLKPPAEIQEPYKTIINRIIDEWNKMESQELGEEDKAMNIEASPDVDARQAFEFMSMLAAQKVKKIISFCKNIPMWKDLDMNLQLKLIKGGLTEAMILYNTPDFDPQKKMVKFMDGKLRSKEAFYTAGYHPDFVDSLFGIWEYCHRHSLTDVTSVALLTASALTSPDRSNKIDANETRLTQDLRPEDQTQINELHSEVVISLQHHLNKISPCRNSFAKAFNVLYKLRNISDRLMPRQLAQFSMLGLNMTPLFSEIYNLPSS